MHACDRMNTLLAVCEQGSGLPNLVEVTQPAGNIHLLMQDADYFDQLRRLPEKYNVHSDECLPVAFSNAFSRQTWLGAIDQTLDSTFDVQDITLGLCVTPSVNGVIPDVVEVMFRRWREDVASHAVLFRLREM